MLEEKNAVPARGLTSFIQPWPVTLVVKLSRVLYQHLDKLCVFPSSPQKKPKPQYITDSTFRVLNM
jgi:hypothetical protein